MARSILPVRDFGPRVTRWHEDRAEVDGLRSNNLPAIAAGLHTAATAQRRQQYEKDLEALANRLRRQETRTDSWPSQHREPRRRFARGSYAGCCGA